jgi:chorismate mutase
MAYLRQDIDITDAQLVELLNQRCEQSLAIRRLKRHNGVELYDAVREAEILNSVAAANAGPLTDTGLRAIFSHILSVMRETSG